MAQTQKCQVIFAPSNETPRDDIVKTVFLAGTTNNVPGEADWREKLAASLADVPVALFNPHRADWDGSWSESVCFPPYREQLTWEMEKQERADVIAFHFHPQTQAAVSLLELGLCARVAGKAVVCCPSGYWKRGNVQMVCEIFGVQMVDSAEELGAAILNTL
ncbi:hypothetical protein N3K66_007720 [Trichothecium roseum]|uniref:Uncharacterized protein n=1 Tax=Trichothecium roseum TaxID=47278 RepID=A0ACC0UWF5_9HYPO|nr:hypothetical protein N3K66_007720 [Trichothecium roseum]